MQSAVCGERRGATFIQASRWAAGVRVTLGRLTSPYPRSHEADGLPMTAGLRTDLVRSRCGCDLGKSCSWDMICGVSFRLRDSNCYVKKPNKKQLRMTKRMFAVQFAKDNTHGKGIVINIFTCSLFFLP